MKEKVFHINDFVSQGKSAIQAAVNECANAGGGTVVVPDGEWLSGPIHLKSNIHLKLEDGAVRLEFKGVSHTANVYFDGEHIAHHYNAYTPFSAVVKNVKQGEHEIRVVVDNSFGEHSALHIPNDYYTYGGITRPVVIESISDVYIKNIRFMPYQKDGVWNAKIEIVICNLSDSNVDINIQAVLAQYKMVKNIKVEHTAK